MMTSERRRIVCLLATLRHFRGDAAKRAEDQTREVNRAYAAHARGMRDGYALAAKWLALALKG